MARRQMLQQVNTTVSTGIDMDNGGARVIDFNSAAAQIGTEPDERFPGSFFRIPGVPSLGKTTWSLTE